MGKTKEKSIWSRVDGLAVGGGGGGEGRVLDPLGRVCLCDVHNLTLRDTRQS